MSECQQCPENTISTAGADSCTPCETGQQANSQKTQCGKKIEKKYYHDLIERNCKKDITELEK